MDKGKSSDVMGNGDFAAGQRYRWRLVEKLGEGDAGEVYRVESLLDRKPAVLKRPSRTAFATDMLRQASQIRSEGQVLRALENIHNLLRPAHVLTPALIDQSTDEAGNGERFFIVLEQATGVDLMSLAKIAHYGLQPGELERYKLTPEAAQWLEMFSGRGEIAPELLVKMLAALFDLLIRIHETSISPDSPFQQGIVWNDVKADHLFWDPGRACLTVIDWGNALFLDRSGISEDRRASRFDDNRQLIDEIGKFLLEESPGLHDELDWPPALLPGDSSQEIIEAVSSRLHQKLEAAAGALEQLQRSEQDLIFTREPDFQQLESLEIVQSNIAAHGVLPDLRGRARLRVSLAQRLANEQRREEFLQLCRLSREQPGEQGERWLLLEKIATAEDSDSPAQQTARWAAVEAGLLEEWGQALWELLICFPERSTEPWWEEITLLARRMQTGDSADTRPFVVVNRLYYTLQALSQPPAPLTGLSAQKTNAPVLDWEKTLRSLHEDVIQKWREREPMPPNADLPYNDIERLAPFIEAAMPDAIAQVERAVSQARAQTDILLDAWSRKDFDTARRGLRRVLLWDPDRLRLLSADAAIAAASDWLAKLNQGKTAQSSIQDFLTEMEFSGKRLRNRVGPAPWLDVCLETLRALRKGARPADLMIQHPEALVEMPWLSAYQAVETISLPGRLPNGYQRQPAPLPQSSIVGRLETSFGPGQAFRLGESLDTWASQARGSSARVFAWRVDSPLPASGAIKLMRPDKVDYALPLFQEEALILNMLRDVPGVNPLLECGFIRLQSGQELPPEERSSSAGELSGEAIRFGPELVPNYLALLELNINQGWIPYLALEKREVKDNLLMFCDAGQTHGRFLPLRDSLMLCIQICDLLQIAHDRNVVYRDHKILHYYWDAVQNGVMVIDWNIARRYAQGLEKTDRAFDLVQFAARAMHHILTGRPAPGALPLGPNRPEDVEQASHSYTAQWTYDDERLPNRVKEILTAALDEGYATARELRRDLTEMYDQLPGSSLSPQNQPA